MKVVIVVGMKKILSGVERIVHQLLNKIKILKGLCLFFFMYAYNIHHVCSGVYESQKKVLEPLKLEL